MLNLERKEQIVLIVVLTVLLFGAGYYYGKHNALSENGELILGTGSGVELESTRVLSKENELNKNIKDEHKREIAVHVSGAVEAPGVYYLEPNSRVIDAVELAIPAANADLHAINLAAHLTDAQFIYVPTKVEAIDEVIDNKKPTHTENSLNTACVPTYARTSRSFTTSPSVVSVNQKININTASTSELETLPGIGPALAKRIIEYRTQSGGFKSIEEIKNVSGIGEKKFDSIKNLITIY